MGSDKINRLKRTFGTGEHGEIDIPKKIGNVKLSRIDHAAERGGCTRCYPHGIETTNATEKKNTRSWKKHRDKRYRTR